MRQAGVIPSVGEVARRPSVPGNYYPLGPHLAPAGPVVSDKGPSNQVRSPRSMVPDGRTAWRRRHCRCRVRRP